MALVSKPTKPKPPGLLRASDSRFVTGDRSIEFLETAGAPQKSDIRAAVPIGTSAVSDSNWVDGIFRIREGFMDLIRSRRRVIAGAREADV